MHAMCYLSAASQEADSALTMYHTLAETGHRELFVKQFEDGGAGKGRDALKFVLNFKKSLMQQDKSAVSSIDSWVTRPKVLEILGLRMSDFDSQEAALKVALPR